MRHYAKTPQGSVAWGIDKVPGYSGLFVSIYHADGRDHHYDTRQHMGSFDHSELLDDDDEDNDGQIILDRQTLPQHRLEKMLVRMGIAPVWT